MKIKVEMHNLKKSLNLLVDYDNNRVVKNGQAVSIDVPAFASKLLAIISSWEKVMINSMVLGGLEYRVEVENGDLKDVYEGRNDFPFNFYEFVDLLTENNLW